MQGKITCGKHITDIIVCGKHGTLVIGVQGNMFPLETYNMYTMSLLLFNSCRLNDNHLD